MTFWDRAPGQGLPSEAEGARAGDVASVPTLGAVNALEESRLWEVSASGLHPDDITWDVIELCWKARRYRHSGRHDITFYEGPGFQPRRAA